MEIKVNDIVMYKSAFLKSTGMYGNIGQLEGKVLKLQNLGNDMILATVEWQDGYFCNVNLKNLVLKSRLHLEPA
jgi:hypothetical protein